MKGINNILNAVPIVSQGKLPSAPQALLKLIECCQKPNVSFDELSGIIRNDAALTARVIAMAQSSALAQWNHVSDLNRILVILGVDTIRTIAVTSAVQQYFSQFSKTNKESLGKCWTDSVTCAHGARALALLTSYEHPEEAYLSGLLHNIGQLVYLQKYPNEYPEMLLDCQASQELDRHEREWFGATSSEVGAYLINDWVPEGFISDAVLYQREPAINLHDTPRLIKVLNLAQKLGASWIEIDSLYAEADQLFGISASTVDQLRGDIRDKLRESAASVGIRLDGESRAQFDDEATHQQLAQHVKGFAMLHGLDAPQDDRQQHQGTWQAILRNLNLLFGLNRTIAFEYRPNDEVLQAIASSQSLQDAPIDELRIGSGSQSLLARSLNEQRSLDSKNPADSAAIPVIDRQVKRLLKREVICTFPLRGPTEALGVIAAGVDEEALQTLSDQRMLIEQFTGMAARKLTELEQLQTRQQLQLDDQRDRLLSRNRKLIHEASNPLGIIQNYLQILTLKLGAEGEVKEQLGVIREEIDRVGEILLRMKTPVQESPQESDETDTNRLISDLVGIYQSSLFSTHQIACQLKLDPNLPALGTNAGYLKQIVTNLLKNAVEAMPDGGSICVETRPINVNGSPYVEIRIQDSGPGLPPAILPQVFTPVESTKGKTHSGLGLTIVANLVTQLEGTISCNNRDEGGAEFVIRLPQTLTPH